MFMNPVMYYHNELMNIFIEALIKDNDSKYKNMTKLQIIESILKENLSFRIDENDTIYEYGVDKIETEIFSNKKKNEYAIYAIKILLEEYN